MGAAYSFQQWVPSIEHRLLIPKMKFIYSFTWQDILDNFQILCKSWQWSRTYICFFLSCESLVFTHLPLAPEDYSCNIGSQPIRIETVMTRRKPRPTANPMMISINHYISFWLNWQPMPRPRQLNKVPVNSVISSCNDKLSEILSDPHCDSIP